MTPPIIPELARRAGIVALTEEGNRVVVSTFDPVRAAYLMPLLRSHAHPAEVVVRTVPPDRDRLDADLQLARTAAAALVGLPLDGHIPEGNVYFFGGDAPTHSLWVERCDTAGSPPWPGEIVRKTKVTPGPTGLSVELRFDSGTVRFTPKAGCDGLDQCDWSVDCPSWQTHVGPGVCVIHYDHPPEGEDDPG